MGLGPPVCVDCGVIGFLEEGRGWRCPNCSSKKLDGHLWTFPKTEQMQIEINTEIAKENKGQSFPDK